MRNISKNAHFATNEENQTHIVVFPHCHGVEKTYIALISSTASFNEFNFRPKYLSARFSTIIAYDLFFCTMAASLHVFVILLAFLASSASWKIILAKNWLKNSASIAIASLVVCSVPENSNARSGNAASNLFADAEDGMQATIQSYRSAKNEWGNAKKLVSSTRSDIASAKAATQKIYMDSSALENKLNTAISESAALEEKMIAEISTLQASTALKYQAAETAALPESKKRPSFTANLFAKAADEASILAKSEGLLVSFKDGESMTSEILKKLSTVVASTSETISTVDSIEQSIQAGNLQLEDGVSPALNEISLVEPISTTTATQQGARLFSAGVGVVEQGSTKANLAFKSLAGTCKGLSSIDDDLSKLAARLGGVVEKQDLWEKDTHLGAKVGSGAMKSFSGKIQTLNKESGGVAAKACEVVDKRDEKDAKDKKEKRPSVVAALKNVQNSLEMAERKAKETDQLIKAASQKGQEEASKYRKFIPVAVDPAISVAAPR